MDFTTPEPWSADELDALNRGELALCDHCHLVEDPNYLFDEQGAVLCAACMDAVESARAYDEATDHDYVAG